MNGPIAQIVALTCHGNALIRGFSHNAFFPENSTCQFCDSINFVELRRLPGKVHEAEVAKTPDTWFEYLARRSVVCLRLGRTASNDPRISDRMAAGFIGGGGTWRLEAIHKDGKSAFWEPRWQVWSKDAPERKIWRVTYGLVGVAKTLPYKHRSLKDVRLDFENALLEIHKFSAPRNLEGFTQCFEKALEAIRNPQAEIGYHKDLFQPGTLLDEAMSLLKAAMSAWVFGGMGSWNDVGFDGGEGKEYQRVSENLFRIINEAIEVAATSTADNHSWG